MAIRVQYRPNATTARLGLSGFRVQGRGVKVIDPRNLHPDNRERGLRVGEDWPSSFRLTPKELQTRIGMVFMVWEPKAKAWLPAIITATIKPERDGDE